MNILQLVFLFASVNGEGLLFVKDYPMHDRVVNVNNASMILLGEVEDCTTYKFQQQTVYNEGRLIVRRMSDIGVECGFSEALLNSTLVGSFDSVYSMYSNLGNDDRGNVLRLLTTPYYHVDLLTVNRNFDYALGWLLSELNTAGPDALLRFFVIAADEIAFKNSFNSRLFDKILESNQILKIVTAKAPNKKYENVTIVLPDSPNLMIMKLFTADNIRLHMRTYNYNDSVVQAVRYEYIIDFLQLAVLPASQGICYKDCINAPRNDSICIKFTSLTAAKYDDKDVYHLKFKYSLDCHFGMKRYTLAYPEWFINYLMSSGQANIDRRLNYIDKSMPYIQLIDPASAIVTFGGNFYRDCLGYNSYESIKQEERFKFSFRNGTSLPIGTLSECYHLITTSQTALPLVYNVNLTAVDVVVRTKADNEDRAFGGEDMFVYLPSSLGTRVENTTLGNQADDESTTVQNE